MEKIAVKGKYQMIKKESIIPVMGISVFWIIIMTTSLAEAAISIYKTYYSNGAIREEYVYENGVPNGKAIFYSETGKKRGTGFFKNGLKDGVFHYFDENGFLEIEQHFVKDMPHGLFKLFSQDGKVIGAVRYKNGVQSGDYRLFYPSGKVSLRLTPPNINGISKRTTYDKSGNIKEISYVQIEKKNFSQSTPSNTSSLTSVSQESLEKSNNSSPSITPVNQSHTFVTQDVSPVSVKGNVSSSQSQPPAQINNPVNSPQSAIQENRAAYQNQAKLAVELNQESGPLSPRILLRGLPPLHQAIWEHRSVEQIKTLITPESVNVLSNGFSPLFYAVITQNIPVLDLLIQSGADVNQVMDNNASVLFYAVARRVLYEIIEKLFMAGFDRNSYDATGNSLIMWAAFYNRDPRVMELFLQNGANPNEVNKQGYTPLIQAAAYNFNPAVLEMLIKYGADVNADNSIHLTPLENAVAFNMIGNIRVLLEAGADVNESRNASSPLIMATLVCSEECIRLLLEAGADIKIQDSAGQTAINYLTARPDINKVSLFQKLSKEHKSMKDN